MYVCMYAVFFLETKGGGAERATIEAPRGGVRGVPLPPQIFFSYLELKIASFAAF